MNKSKNKQIITSQDYKQIHMFSTENITGITENIDFTNKDILTVQSSGDQFFNINLYNTKTVDVFDNNPYTNLIFHLKLAAIQALSLQEFLDFFFPKAKVLKNKLFSLKTYLKIRQNFQNQFCLSFWDNLFFNHPTINIYHSNVFTQEHYNKKITIACNPYLKNESNYNLLKQKLKNKIINYYQLDIIKDTLNSSNKYDYIYLSNILDCLLLESETEYTNQIKTTINKLTTNNLKENGKIIISYLYCYLDDYWDNQKYITLKSQLLRQKQFKNYYSYLDFPGISNLTSKRAKDKDAILIYTKK